MISFNITAEQTRYFSGVAQQAEYPHKILYREEHQLLLSGNKLQQQRVSYYDPLGEMIAEKVNDYSTNLSQPEFILTDYRHNYREELRQVGSKFLLSLTENGTTQTTLISEADYPLVIDVGFNQFIKQHWRELSAGNTLYFSFVSVARLSTINFRITAENPQQFDQPLKLKMSLASPWLSWLVSPIELRYRRSNADLLSYRGLSNISDTQGKGQKVMIRYQYLTRPTQNRISSVSRSGH